MSRRRLGAETEPRRSRAKTSKNPPRADKISTPPAKKKSVSDARRRAQNDIEPITPIYLIYFCIFVKNVYTMDGLIIKNGRLMNFRRDGESGIEEAARLRADMKGSKVVRNIADGIELAEERKTMREIFGAMPVSMTKRMLK